MGTQRAACRAAAEPLSVAKVHSKAARSVGGMSLPERFWLLECSESTSHALPSQARFAGENSKKIRIKKTCCIHVTLHWLIAFTYCLPAATSTITKLGTDLPTNQYKKQVLFTSQSQMLCLFNCAFWPTTDNFHHSSIATQKRPPSQPHMSSNLNDRNAID